MPKPIPTAAADDLIVPGLPTGEKITIDALAPEDRKLVLDAVREWRLTKELEAQMEGHKKTYKSTLMTVLGGLPKGFSLCVPGLTPVNIWINPNTKSTLDKNKLRELLLENLSMVPEIDIIIRECFAEATVVTSGEPFPTIAPVKRGGG